MGLNGYLGRHKVHTYFLFSPFIMCVVAFRLADLGTIFLLLLGKLAKGGQFRDSQKVCRVIYLRLSGSLGEYFQPFRTKWGLKVRISIFPWQPFRISKFRPFYGALWPWQIVRAQYRSDRSINGEVVKERKKRLRPPACVLNKLQL